jgi:hypothetical protein
VALVLGAARAAVAVATSADAAVLMSVVVAVSNAISTVSLWRTDGMKVTRVFLPSAAYRVS